MFATISEDAIQTAADHLRGVLEFAVERQGNQSALVVFDAQCELAQALTLAYRRCLPQAQFVSFDHTDPAELRARFGQLQPSDLVVLIQSTSFRLDAYRIRIELFQRALKVIEHPHLARMQGREALIYIDSLAYDPEYFRGVGHDLKQRLDRGQVLVVESQNARLVFPAAFEPAKLNVGDYRGMKNVGGQFPIGEVFTESKDLEAVHGQVRIACFGDTSFTVNRPEHPITLVVERGRVTDALDATHEFGRVLATIRADDGEIWLRELGFGINRAFTLDRTVSDIGTFERMCGVHFSLGSKHAIYNKPNIDKKTAKHHVDVFADTRCVVLDDEVIFSAGSWRTRAQNAGQGDALQAQ